MGVLKGDDKGRKKIFEEVIAWNFQNVMENINLYIQEVQGIPNK